MNILENTGFLNKAHERFDNPLTELEHKVYELAAWNRDVYAKTFKYEILRDGTRQRAHRYTGNFHVVNKFKTAVTITLTYENVLKVRGREFLSLDNALKFADSLK